MPRLPAGAKDLGPAPAGERLRFDVVLTPRNPVEMAQLASAVSTPGNPSYRHFWSAAQLRDAFGPEAATVTAVTSALSAEGLSVTGVSADRSIVSVSGTMAQIDAALGVSMQSIRLESGRVALANASAPKLPAPVGSAVQGVVGLNTMVELANPLPPAVKGSPSGMSAVSPHITGAPSPCTAASTAATDSGSYTADQLAHAYSLDGLWTKGDFGSGVTIAVFELGQAYDPTDISAFQACYGTSTSITNESVDGMSVTGTPGGDEFTLDLETLIGAAPKASILAYSAPAADSYSSLFSNWLDEEKKIVTDDLASVVSESYGICENAVSAVDPAFITAENTNFEQAALEGQSWMVSTGDTGSQGSARAFGNFEDSYNANSYIPEHAIAVDAATHVSYVLNYADNLVIAVDDVTGTVLGEWAPPEPVAIAFDQTTQTVYVADYNGAAVQTIDASACTVVSCSTAKIALTSRLALPRPALAPVTAPSVGRSSLLSVNQVDLVENPATGTLYLSVTDKAGSTDYVLVASEKTGDVVAEIQLHQAGSSALWQPATLAIDPTASAEFYVSDFGGGSVFGIDGATCDASVTTGCGTAWAYTFGSNKVASTLTANPSTGGVLAAVETNLGASPGLVALSSSGSLVRSVDLGDYISGSLGSAQQIQTAISPSGNELLVTGYSAGNAPQGIVVIPLATLAIAAIVPVDYCANTATAGCYLGFMASDPTTGTVLIDAAEFNESQIAGFLTESPLDVPVSTGGLSPEDPSTQPYVTAVGGTSLQAEGPAPTESTWNNALVGGGAGTGGVSALWTMPSWQQGTGVISSDSSNEPCGASPGSYCREVPDVSADADPYTGYVLYLDGGWGGGEGGTSASTPLFAATIALAQASLISTPRMGLLNPSLYVLAGSSQAFNDVTTGNIDNLGTAGGLYPAAAAYDMATGLGSPIATTLIAGLTQPPAAPSGALATAGPGTAQVSWTAPATSTLLPIAGYVVTPYVGTTAQTAKTFSSTATTEEITGLTPGTSYTFKVAAFNAGGTGAASSASTAVVPYAVPGAPTSVTAVAGTQSATVHWVDPASDGYSPITSYTATAYIGSVAQAQSCAGTGATATSCVVGGLAPGTGYSFEVTATNAAGTGAASSASTTVVPYTMPGAPTSVTALAGNQSATVHWVDPASNGFSAITSYTATAYIGSAAQAQSCAGTGATATSCVVGGLTAGTSYSFEVTATNAAGTGAASSASTAVVPYAVPGAPGSVTAVAGKASATVQWVDPVLNGYSPITSYTATAYVGTVAQTKSCTVTGATATTCVVSGLTPGTSYTFEVTASNTAGASAASSPSTAVVPYAVPGAPTSVTAEAGKASVTVHWVDPASDGYSPITGYTATAYVGTVAQTKTCTAPGPTSTSCVVSGLTVGRSYTFKVTATNVAGTGSRRAPRRPSFPAPWPERRPRSPLRLARRAPSCTGSIRSSTGTRRSPSTRRPPTSGRWPNPRAARLPRRRRRAAW